jgi:probable HAF family extracellular repeat protein
VGSARHAFRIGADGVMTDLGSLAGANKNSVAFATNGDGSVVVGQTDVTNDQHAFKWTLTPGGDTGVMTDLGGSSAIATAVSVDGSVAVGGSLVAVPGSFAKLHAAMWTKASGPIDLGTLPGHTASIATGVSGDGTIVVGISDPAFVDIPLGASGYRYSRDTSRAFV